MRTRTDVSLVCPPSVGLRRRRVCAGAGDITTGRTGGERIGSASDGMSES